MNDSRKAVCLFSGGLDSTTALYIAKSEGFEPLALSVYYGQIHKREIENARRLTQELTIKHEVISISLPWGGSSLLDSRIEIPKGRNESEMQGVIPSTYVPARNTIFLSFASSWAEAAGADAIYLGINSQDYSGYPDCRPEFIFNFTKTLHTGTKAGAEGKRIEIKTPLLFLSKREIIEWGHKLQVPYEKTWSCYEGGDVPCEECDSCLLRAKGFREANLNDPLIQHEKSSVH